MHAASCIPVVTGAWQYEGGGAFHNNGAIYHWNKDMIEAHEAHRPGGAHARSIAIGAILEGDADALHGGPPVTALLIQNTNPVSVAPDQNVVKRGFAREDLFTCVHEQFMTETAAMADIVLPATMFMEHDDVYQAGGSQYILLGPEACRRARRMPQQPRRDLRAGAAARGGASRALRCRRVRSIDWTLQKSGWGDLETLERERWIDCQPPFEQAHYLDGFKWPDEKFRFKPDWPEVPFKSPWTAGPVNEMPSLPDYWEMIETVDAEHPFRLATSPARQFLNSTFNDDADLGEAGRASDADDASGRRFRASASPMAIDCGSAIGAARYGCMQNFSTVCGVAS